MLRSIRSLRRLILIAITFARHGALAPFEQAHGRRRPGAGRCCSSSRPLFGRQVGDKRPGERLALALSELGPAFIKLGQVLSTRPSDLLGEQVAEDLAKLQDQLPAFSAFQARATIETELGTRASRNFLPVRRRAGLRRLDQPGALSPSRCRTRSGRKAVRSRSKVLRPGIEEAFAADIELLLWLAYLIERTQPRLRRLKPVEVVQTFAATVRRGNGSAPGSRRRPRSCGRISPAIPTYRVPEIDWRRTAKRAMTQERLTGIPMDDRVGMLARRPRYRRRAAKAAPAFFNQAFRDGYFHGDQHPGNMTVGYDGAIQVVDFGIMGRLDKRTRYFLADMLLAFLQRDYAKVAEVYVDAGYLPAGQVGGGFHPRLALDRRADPRPAAAPHLLRARARPAVQRGRELPDGSAAASCCCCRRTC